MTLDNLKLFLAVANTGSFSKAAQISEITQSAISKRILQLELQLGHRLFERHGRGASMTDAGRLLVSMPNHCSGRQINWRKLLAANSRKLKVSCAWHCKHPSPGR
jgi:molybdenum-dependent DNA-binding transcriptional regulator ModE